MEAATLHGERLVRRAARRFVTLAERLSSGRPHEQKKTAKMWDTEAQLRVLTRLPVGARLPASWQMRT